MTWIVYLVLAAFAIYLMYNFAALSIFGVPRSLSKTFYLYQERVPWQRFLFPIMMISMGFLLAPAWIELSAASPFQFTAFFGIVGIVFTGAAPAFNKTEMENKVHTFSAIFAAVFSLLWIILVAKVWWFIIAWGIMVLLVALFTKTLKTSYVYWLETIAFLSTFTAIMTMFVTL